MFAAKREIALWFNPEELINSTNVSEPWIYEETKPKQSEIDSSVGSSSAMRTAGLVALAIAVVGTGIYLGRK